MRLCMFTPIELRLERGWPGRIEGDRVIQLAAQTLQSYFSGGGSAREHAEHSLADVVLRAPVLHPPSVRLFDDDIRFAFASATSILGPDDDVRWPEGAERLEYGLRLAAVIGGEGRVEGITVLNDWRAPGLPPAKDADFATSLGPVLVGPGERTTDAVAWVNGEERARLSADPPWEAMVAQAARSTELRPGDLICSPVLAAGAVDRGDVVELEVEGIGVLRSRVV